MAAAPSIEAVEVSPEMTAVLGGGPPSGVPLPDRAAALVFRGSPGGAPSTVTVVREARRAWAGPQRRLTLVVKREAVTRLGGAALLAHEGAFHVPSGLREMAVAILTPAVPVEARSTYRLAKSIELLCETLKRHADGELVPMAAEGALSAVDTRRVLAARRLIDERWGEKLTLDGLSRACGLNRSKLTRGFRDLFGCSVAEALAERRLESAGRMLLTTDKPISSVGYEAGYLNNASFTRAFGRRFGRTPTDYRTGALAA